MEIVGCDIDKAKYGKFFTDLSTGMKIEHSCG